MSNFTAADVDAPLVVDCVELTRPPERCAPMLEAARLRELALSEAAHKVDEGPYGNVVTQHAVNLFELQEAVRESCTGFGECPSFHPAGVAITWPMIFSYEHETRIDYERSVGLCPCVSRRPHATSTRAVQTGWRAADAGVGGLGGLLGN